MLAYIFIMSRWRVVINDQATFVLGRSVHLIPLQKLCSENVYKVVWIWLLGRMLMLESQCKSLSSYPKFNGTIYMI